MMNMKIISFDELTDKIESDGTDDKFKICGESLLAALNDWPTLDLKEPIGLLNELKNEVGEPLTFDNLKRYSVASLLEMFDFDRNNTFDKDVTMDKIIERLTNHLRTVK
jgi:hypothetical protein